MAEVRAFRGVRFRGEAERDLGHVLAPPYDAAPPGVIERLRASSPFNMVHLEQAGAGGGPAAAGGHALAAARYRAWLEEGILVPDPRPALYLYDETFAHGDRRLTRRGLFAAVRLAAWEQRAILPHEETFPAPRIERLNRLRAVRANLSPLYLLYRDPHGELRRLLDAAARLPPDATVTDPSGSGHRLTALAESDFSARVDRFFAGRRLYVADGHHRYEAALAYRDERIARSQAPDPAAPADFVLALLVDAADPGVVVLPTHRLVRGLHEFDPAAVRARLGALFDLRPLAGGDGGTDDAVGAIGFAGESGLWQLRAKPGAPHEALMPAERSSAWRRLPVAILGSVVVRHVLGIAPDRIPAQLTFAHDATVARAALAQGETQIAFLLRPTSLDDLIAVADAGDRLPPKSTYFEPKIPAGLVIHDLDRR